MRQWAAVSGFGQDRPIAQVEHDAPVEVVSSPHHARTLPRQPGVHL